MSKPFEWGWAIWYYDYDGLGTVSEIVDWQGVALEKYTYDEYGSFTITDGVGNPLTSSPSGNRFFFTGREYDFLTKLYYYRARWYDAGLGRFLQTDPVGYKAGDINLYRYVTNNPVNLVDPKGLEGKPKGKKTKVGHVTVHSPILITGMPTIYVTWNTPEGRFAELLASLPPGLLALLMQSMGGNLPEGYLASIDPATASLVCLTAVAAGIIEWFWWVTHTDMEDSIPTVENKGRPVEQPKIGGKPVPPVTIPPPLEPAPWQGVR